jgi:hypothetical protein
MIDLTLFHGWIPYRVEWRGYGPEVDWCYLGERPFREPFFDHTIRSVLRDPFHLSARHHTPIQALADMSAVRPGLPLGGLIFHMSRCGSTLISRLLASSPTNLVLSEAPPIDEVLDMARRGASEEQRIAWLRGLVSALGQPRTGQEQRMFIKLDSWHVLDLPLIRRAFPDTPWIFVYRDPVEVMMSHKQLRGSQMAPGQLPPARLGLDATAVQLPLDLDKFCARVLGNFCTAAAQYAPMHGGMLVNYNQFPDAIWSDILPWFRVAPTEAEREEMELEMMYHAKQPAHPFQPDSEAKRRAASPALRALAEQFIAPAYYQLEAVRQNHAA